MLLQFPRKRKWLSGEHRADAVRVNGGEKLLIFAFGMADRTVAFSSSVKGELAKEIAAALYGVSAYQLPKICDALGMSDGTGQKAIRGKKQYVLKRVEGWSQEALLALAEKVVAQSTATTWLSMVAEQAATCSEKLAGAGNFCP